MTVQIYDVMVTRDSPTQGESPDRSAVEAAKPDDALAGRASYDELDGATQARVRDAWQRGIDALDLAVEFRAAGRSWSEPDDDGNLVIVHA